MRAIPMALSRFMYLIAEVRFGLHRRRVRLRTARQLMRNETLLRWWDSIFGVMCLNHFLGGRGSACFHPVMCNVSAQG